MLTYDSSHSIFNHFPEVNVFIGSLLIISDSVHLIGNSFDKYFSSFCVNQRRENVRDFDHGFWNRTTKNTGMQILMSTTNFNAKVSTTSKSKNIESLSIGLKLTRKSNTA